MVRTQNSSPLSCERDAHPIAGDKPGGSAAFQLRYMGRDMAAGLVTGTVAIPLTVGIAMMSNYPIKVGLATVVFASLIGWLLAGVGLTIFMKFFSFTYEIPEAAVSTEGFWNGARLQMVLISAVAYGIFVALIYKLKDKQPAIPYFVLIVAGVILARFVDVPMLFVEEVELRLAAPVPRPDNLLMLVYMLLFCSMLAVIDVIEQVMSNAAIEKIDPLKRKCDCNNSLLAIWVANLGSSLFGGMTNLDGLAKSTTNKLAGAYTKFSIVIVALVVAFLPGRAPIWNTCRNLLWQR